MGRRGRRNESEYSQCVCQTGFRGKSIDRLPDLDSPNPKKDGRLPLPPQRGGSIIEERGKRIAV